MAQRDIWPGAAGPKELIDGVCKEIAPMLTADGFKKTGRNWRQTYGVVTHVVNLEASPWNAAARDFVETTRASFTINLGVHVGGLDELIGWPAPSGAVAVNLCHIQLRIGELVDGRDLWWNMSSERDLPHVSGEVAKCMQETALPWLANHADLLSVQKWFDDPPEGALVVAAVRDRIGALRPST